MLTPADTDTEAPVAVERDAGVGEHLEHEPHGGPLVAVDAEQRALLGVPAARARHHHQVPRAVRVRALQFDGHLERVLRAQQVEHGLQVLLDVGAHAPAASAHAVRRRQHQRRALPREVALAQAACRCVGGVGTPGAVFLVQRAAGTRVQ